MCENRLTIVIYRNIDAPQKYERGQQKSKIQKHIMEFHLYKIFKYAKLNNILFRNKGICHKIINKNQSLISRKYSQVVSKRIGKLMKLVIGIKTAS